VSDKVTKLLEALTDSIETATARDLLTAAEEMELLEALQVEIDDMLERLTVEIGEAEDEDAAD
jgi:hypothetical protein